MSCLTFWVLACLFGWVHSNTLGPLSGTSAFQTTEGNAPWNEPSGALQMDSTAASVYLNSANLSSNPLVITGFNITDSQLADDSRITGITVRVRIRTEGSNTTSESQIQLMYGNGVLSVPKNPDSIIANDFGNFTSGAWDDTWGFSSLNATDIKYSDFSVLLEVNDTNADFPGTVYVDSISIFVSFNVTASTTAISTSASTHPSSTQTNPSSTQTNPSSTQTNPPSTQTNPPSTRTNPSSTQTNPSSTQTNAFSTQTNPSSSQAASNTTDSQTFSSVPQGTSINQINGPLASSGSRTLIMVIVIPVGFVLLLILIILLILLGIRRRRNKHAPRFREDDDLTELIPIQLPPLDESTLVVSIFKLTEHIETLKKPLFPNRQDINGFHAEFNWVEEKSEKHTYDFTTASLPVNAPKNRYQNVLAPEQTRVKLTELEGSDYVNGNFINGQIPGSEKAYIASQGPVQAILSDFWRMVWETNASVVLMLTKEVENARLKCDQYWADVDSPLTLDNFKLTLQDINEKDELTTRKLLLENVQTGESRVVTQFQYTAWPDHGVPVSTNAFLELSTAAETANATKGPILAHCSAGIGRTGTFCTIHSTLKRIELELSQKTEKDPTINIAEVVLKLREQRPSMVQTVEQYEFCYLAINDGIKQLLKESKSGGSRLKSPSDADLQKSFIQE